MTLRGRFGQIAHVGDEIRHRNREFAQKCLNYVVKEVVDPNRECYIFRCVGVEDEVPSVACTTLIAENGH